MMEKEKINLTKKLHHILFLVLCCVFSFCSMGLAEAPQQPAYMNQLAALEKQHQAIVGVYVMDTENGRTLAYRADERFSYCSTHKVLLAGAILQRFSLDDLNEVIHYSADDILSYAPVTKKHIDDGMPLGELCESAIRVSDNTAANLMLQKLGGPKVFKACLQEIGDDTTKPVRTEPELNVRNGKKDTSTPRQLALDLQSYTFGDVLTEDKKALLLDWMQGNATGDHLIRAGVPKDYQVADKSGSGAYGTRNDIAVIYPPGRKPIVLAILTTHKERNAKTDDALVAETTEIIMNALQQGSVH